MKKLIPNFILLLLTLGLIEGGSYLTGLYLKKKGVFYNLPDISNYQEYMIEKHPVLGWPSKTRLKKDYDSEGSRPIPAFPNPNTPSCVSIYGDSFTWGDHVSDENSVSNLLSEKLNCRVSNFGVSGYGTDQMYLRFKLNEDDEAPVVILNHFSGDIRRNVTRLRNLMAESDSEYILFKPRFILDNQAVRLLPIPSPSLNEVKNIAEHPERFLTDEYYLPGGHSGINYLKFPYTLSVIGAFNNEHVQAKIKGVPVWALFYEQNHPSQALEITSQIMLEFNTLATARNKKALILLSANVHDIEYFRKSGKWSYDPLIKKLKEQNLLVLNAGPELNSYIGKKDPCILGNESCYGHLTAEGNQQIAKFINTQLNSDN